VLTGGQPWSDFVLWAAAAATVGDLQVEGVTDMIAQLQAVCRREQGVIGRLNVMDHTWQTGDPAEGGDGDPGPDRLAVQLHGDIISVENIGMWEERLRAVGRLMADRGFVHLWHCKIGRNERLLRLMARAIGKDVYAGTANHNALNFQYPGGEYVVAGPDGTFARGAARPAMR
jgi:hypothetical protein